ncbi:MAG: metallophosphoesterase [Oscillospiraceae bacterium]|jgi:predicted MPP superfamily phosphohydrolase|nr:metallophosphoesterase [Oscillospiraceae bacterium]
MVGKRARGGRVSVAVKLLIALALAFAAAVYDSNTRIDVAEYTLRFGNLPASFDGLRIASLSDVHAAQFGKNNEKLIAAVVRARPDIIALTGDLIDDTGQLGIIDTLVGGLADIAPVYYVTGNHEWDSGDMRNLQSLLEQRGVTVLRNAYIPLTISGESVVLAGTDDPNGPSDMVKPEKFIEDIRRAEGDKFLIVLEHRNNHLEMYSSLGVDLIICGHAHGGIVRLPFTDGLVGPSREILPTYTNGVYTAGATSMLVSRGVGNHTGYPRFLNNPHIPVAVLRRSAIRVETK